MWSLGGTDVKAPGSIISFTNIRHGDPVSKRPSVTRLSTGLAIQPFFSSQPLTVLTLVHNLCLPQRVRSASEITCFLFVCHACQPVSGSGVIGFHFVQKDTLWYLCFPFMLFINDPGWSAFSQPASLNFSSLTSLIMLSFSFYAFCIHSFPNFYHNLHHYHSI